MRLSADIIQKLQACVAQGGRIWLAYSGGLDSSVLLHFFAGTEFKAFTSVIHVNHGLSVHADRWQTHCDEQCAALALNLVARKVVVNDKNGGLEAGARDARYRVFTQLMHAGDVLLTGHHQDDQAETLLYRLARGAGLKGLAAMPAERELARGTLIRPFLNVARDDLHAWAEQRGLSWITDDSNDDVSFDRNYIRHRILPVLKSRWPRFSVSAERCAANLRADLDLLQFYLALDLTACDVKSERLGQSLDLSRFSSYLPLRQYALLRYWLQTMGQQAPEQANLEQLHALLAAAEDKQPELIFGALQLRRYRQRLYLVPRLSLEPQDAGACWQTNVSLNLASGGRLYVKASTDMPIDIRYREGGERCKPATRTHSQSLKKLLQEYELEPWLRDQVPIVYSGETMLAVGDLFLTEHAAEFGLQYTQWSYTNNE